MELPGHSPQALTLQHVFVHFGKDETENEFPLDNGAGRTRMEERHMCLSIQGLR